MGFAPFLFAFYEIGTQSGVNAPKIVRELSYGKVMPAIENSIPSKYERFMTMDFMW